MKSRETVEDKLLEIVKPLKPGWRLFFQQDNNPKLKQSYRGMDYLKPNNVLDGQVKVQTSN